MANRELQDPQSGARGPHLHFQIPAVGFFPHAEPFQHIAADRPQRAHVRIVHAVERAHEEAGDTAGDELVHAHAALLAHAPGAGADDEILLAGEDRSDQPGNFGGIVAAVAVDEGHHRALRRTNPGDARRTVTRPRLDDDARAGGPGPGGGLVGAAAVDHNDFADDVARDRAHHIADRVRLVEHRNDQRYAGVRVWWRQLHRLQRSPQFAQHVGGASLNSSRRNFR